MSTTPTTPPTDPNAPQPGEVITAPPPPPPKTPLDPPKVYYNLKWHVPPIVVHFQEDADALDPTEWATIPASGTPPPEPKYPQLYYDINVPPIVVDSAEDLKTIDTSRYKPFAFTKGLLDASQANFEATGQPPPATS
jgi:hypothetical protein